MTDIMKRVVVDVHCDQCSDYTVGADVIAESQRLLADGCPGSPYECPPMLFARLLPYSALESLERAWSALESAARDSVRKIAFDGSLRVVLRPGDELDALTISRWEDDGGYVPRAQRSAYGKRSDFRRTASMAEHRWPAGAER